MSKISLASYKKFLTNHAEVVVLTAPVNTPADGALADWYSIKDLWYRETCNILWITADSMMIKPTNMFNGRFDEYRLFNTHGSTHSDNSISLYMDPSIQFFSQAMDTRVWDLGELWMEHRNGSWTQDLLRYNKMFWGQDIDPDDACHPEFCWQAFGIENIEDPDLVQKQASWNGLRFEKAHIARFWAEKDSGQALTNMQRLAQRLDIAVQKN